MGIFNIDGTQKYPSRGPNPDKEKDEDSTRKNDTGNAYTVSDDNSEYWEEVYDECIEDDELSRENVQDAAEYAAVHVSVVLQGFKDFDITEVDREMASEMFDNTGGRWEYTDFADSKDAVDDGFLSGATSDSDSSSSSSLSGGLQGLVSDKKNDG